MKPFLTVQILVFVMSLLMASPVMAEKLANLSSGYCLDTDGRAVNGGVVRMWNCATHPNQTWTVEQVDSTFYRLINHSSKFCLDTDGSKMNGAQVRMWGCANHPNQLWEIHSLPENRYRLLNKASGFCLDTDGRAANGGIVRMWNCANHPNQSWLKLEQTIGAHLVRGVACRDVRNNQPWGEMGKAGTFPPGPINICRYMEFAGVGGHHDIELVAYRASAIGSQQFQFHSSKKDFIDDPTPQNSYAIWFCDKRDNGNWQEQVLLDGRHLGRIDYTVGGIGE